MKKMFFLCAFINTCLFAQVGINKEAANATLDIQSNNNSSETKSIKLSNQSNKEVFYISDNGQFYFNSAFKPNGNPGEKGQYLVSKGPEKSPEWEYLPIFFSQFSDIFNITYKSDLTDLNKVKNMWTKVIELNNIRLAVDPQIAKWQDNEIIINRKGVYHLLISTKLFTNTLKGTASMRVNVSNSKSYQVDAIRTKSSSGVETVYYNSMNEDIVLPLNVGDRVTLEIYCDVDWRLANALLYIKHLEI